MRISAGVFLASALILSLVACGGGGGSTPPVGNPTATPSANRSSSPSPSPSPNPSTSGSPTPSSVTCTTPSSSSLWAFHVQNSTGQNGQVNLYVYGTNASGSGSFYVTSASGATQATTPNSTISSFALPADGCFDVPQGISVRIYVALNNASLYVATNSSGTPIPPVFWGASTGAYAPNVSSIYDFVEYTWMSGQSMNFDSTQVDELTIPISWQDINPTVPSNTTVNTPMYGAKPNALTNAAADLNSLAAPWPSLVAPIGGITHALNPQNAAGNGAVANFDAGGGSTFWDNAVNTIWSDYPAGGSAYLPINYNNGQYVGYGQVTGTTMNFYATASSAGAVIASINKPTTTDVWGTAGNLAPPGAPILTLELGRALGVSILRGTLPAASPASTPTQPLCAQGDWQNFYGGSQTNGGETVVTSLSGSVDWFAAEMHKYAYAPTAGINGLAYGFSDDDECNIFVSDLGIPYMAGNQMNLTLNPF